MKIAALRKRATGTEASVIDDAGREFVLWMQGEGDPDVAWATPHVERIKRAEAEEAAKQAQAEGAFRPPQWAKFRKWLGDERERKDVRSLLMPLARLYVDEVL
uniref:Uncharacterized protein n=1 Tax=viral metagenome TaxID=1070528 RepID=A0A6H1ZEM9_9ZZZZ